MNKYVEELIEFPYESTQYPFNIEVCGITLNSAHKYERAMSHIYIFEYIISGSAELEVDGSTYYPCAGDVYILKKGTSHRYSSSEHDPWTKIWFNVDGTLVPNLLNTFGLQNDVLIKGFNNEKPFRDFYELTHKNLPLSELLLKASQLFLEILFLLHRHKALNRTDSSAVRIREMINANLYEKLSLEQISKHFMLSKAQIINIFKEKFGLTPYQYFIREKVCLAASMLSDTSLSIDEISNNLCFADPNYFCNVFKKVMGLPPTKYRLQKKKIYDQLSNLNLKIHIYGEKQPFSQDFSQDK